MSCTRRQNWRLTGRSRSSRAVPQGDIRLAPAARACAEGQCEEPQRRWSDGRVPGPFMNLKGPLIGMSEYTDLLFGGASIDMYGDVWAFQIKAGGQRGYRRGMDAEVSKCVSFVSCNLQWLNNDVLTSNRNELVWMPLVFN